MTSITFRSASLLPLPLLLLTLGLGLTGCGDAKNEAAVPAPTTEGPRDDRAERDREDDGAERSRPSSDAPGAPVWFETLLARPFLPNMAVSLCVFPDGSEFMVLGRNGDLFCIRGRLDAFALAPRGSKQARVGNLDAIQEWGTVVTIPDVGGRKDIGSIGMTLDPDFATNRMFYIWYADGQDEFVKLDRFTFDHDADSILASRVNIIAVNRRSPPQPYHMGGIVRFLTDKTLVIMIGDAERQEISQDRQDLNGKMLRIIPDRGPEGGYTVPEDNPFVGDPSYRPEILAMGLRAPFRGFVHRAGGQDLLFFGDVGGVFEEINVWRTGVTDFGWGHGHLADGPSDRPGVTSPLVWWDKDERFCAEDPEYDGATRMSAACSMIYDHPRDPYRGVLTGKLLFYDLQRGWMRLGELTDDFRVARHEHFAHLMKPADMVVGRDGYVYGLVYAGPTILWRMRMD